ncbi:hypothetical protein ACLOJK_023964, partial [Asimina triloba]
MWVAVNICLDLGLSLLGFEMAMAADGLMRFENPSSMVGSISAVRRLEMAGRSWPAALLMEVACWPTGRRSSAVDGGGSRHGFGFPWLGFLQF